MSFVLDFLIMRRPVLKYVSPPVCEIIFSSTGISITLDPINPLIAPSGLELGGLGGNNLVWNVYPNAICYNVYRAINSNDPFGPYELVSECEPNPEIPVDPNRCYRVSAITLDGESALSDPFCVPVIIPPFVDTEPATDIQSTSAIINGIANPNGSATNVYFQWGGTIAYGNQTASQSVGAGNSEVTFDDLLTGLTTNTIYHFRAVASSAGGTVFGADEQFTTPGGGGCGPFPRCGHPEDILYDCRPRIVGYADGLFSLCPTCLPSAAPAWDGFFRFPTGANYCGWTTGVFPAVSLSGRQVLVISIGQSGGTWSLLVACNASTFNNTLWTGNKVGGDTPDGVYIFDSSDPGCGSAPASLTIAVDTEPP